MTTESEEHVGEKEQGCLCPICWELTIKGEMCPACTYLGCTDRKANCA